MALCKLGLSAGSANETVCLRRPRQNKISGKPPRRSALVAAGAGAAKSTPPPEDEGMIVANAWLVQSIEWAAVPGLEKLGRLRAAGACPPALIDGWLAP
jgi:hypothetical protein